MAGLFTAALGLAALLRKRRSPATWCFCAGMFVLTVESALCGMSLRASVPEEVLRWQCLAWVARSFLPVIWISFSLVYSRGNYTEFLMRSRFVLAAALVIPVSISIGFSGELLRIVQDTEGTRGSLLAYGRGGKALNAVLLISIVLVLMNLEATFRSAVGTMRWRIKFLLLGLGVIFGARIYTASQALLFTDYDLTLVGVESAAVLVGCALIAIGYLRSGFAEIDVYPSPAVLHSSVTVLLAGGYLLVVGVLAQVISGLGGAGNFQIQAFVVLLGIAGLAALLLSDRLRQKLHAFISRHFKTPEHDFRKVWTLFTRNVSSRLTPEELCDSAAKLISEVFEVLSVTIWLADHDRARLVFGASTSQLAREADLSAESAAKTGAVLDGLADRTYPFDLEKVQEQWGETLRRLGSAQFREGGNRVCVPLIAGNRPLGVLILADRVNGVRYSVEELDLLKCIGDQIGASLLNLRLTAELMSAKELAAFQTMSAFFVHDLKNAASSLGLMLQNLPVHFDNPRFREDALRGIGTTVNRINQLIERLSSLREMPEPKAAAFDLNRLIEETLQPLSASGPAEFVRKLQPLPEVLGDRQQLQTVVTNLLLNAGEAVGGQGQVIVQTARRDGCAVLTVADNGCGMSPGFIKDSLFRPFRTTKKKGIGIGMFQSKAIVEANRGAIQVESEPGKGTTFHVTLPLAPQPQ